MSRKANLRCAAFGLLPRQLQLASGLLMIRRFFVFSKRGCPGAGCPILLGYRTTASSAGLWLSDSFGLSDSRIISRALVVRFFRIIGQPHHRPGTGCPILPGYRTTTLSFVAAFF